MALYSRASKLIGLDVSATALGLAAQRLALHGIDPTRVVLEQVRDDRPEIPLEDASVDYVNCGGVLHHTSSPEELLAELRRVLRPDGRAFVMVYNSDSVWLHLYVAYEKMLHDEAYAGFDLDEAFRRLTDGVECPISRHYAPAQMIASCERAGLSARYVGGYLSRHELHQLETHWAGAIADERLGDPHRDFLRSLSFDAWGRPMIRGFHAGIGGVYHLRRRHGHDAARDGPCSLPPSVVPALQGRGDGARAHPSFKRFSRFPVWKINSEFGFPPGLDDVARGVVILHYCCSAPGAIDSTDVSSTWLGSRPETLKVAFFQDEYYFCQKRFGFVNEPASTSFSRTSARSTYRRSGSATRPAHERSSTSRATSTTACSRRRRFALPDERATSTFGYRGRPLPPHMGAGSQEKRVIGERFKALAAGSLPCASTSRPLNPEPALRRGPGIDFLGRSRATLGVESGVSFIDLEDECHAEYMRLAPRTDHEPTLEELQAGALGRWDGNIPYRTLGPRHLEAAAFRVCQVLYEGEYSGAMQPGVHYIPLAKDFSNFDDVLAAR